MGLFEKIIGEEMVEQMRKNDELLEERRKKEQIRNNDKEFSMAKDIIVPIIKASISLSEESEKKQNIFKRLNKKIKDFLGGLGLMLGGLGLILGWLILFLGMIIIPAIVILAIIKWAFGVVF